MSTTTPQFNLHRDASSAVGPIYDLAHITATGTALVKSGAGVLHSITFNKPVATGTVEFDNALTNTNAMGIITVPSSPQPVTLVYDVQFDTGLSITVGTAAQDLTIAYL